MAPMSGRFAGTKQAWQTDCAPLPTRPRDMELPLRNTTKRGSGET